MRILSSWLEKHDKSQKWLAKQLGCTPGLVSQWITGRTDPTVEWIKKISDVTGIAIDELVESCLERGAA